MNNTQFNNRINNLYYLKSAIFYFLSLIIFLTSCKESLKVSFVNDSDHSIIVDSSFRDTVIKHIQFKSERYFSSFKTPLEARYFQNGIQTDSIITNGYDMMSWYSIRNDTIDMVAHLNHFETAALLVRFLNGKQTVLFYRAPHELGDDKHFRVTKKQPYSYSIEVIPKRYHLILSEIPDTMNKQIVYGYIDMESGDYYDNRDSLEQRENIHMQFYFRSQYRRFDY